MAYQDIKCLGQVSIVEKLSYKGVPIESLSKKELVEAIKVLHNIYLNERESFKKMSELASKSF